MNNYPSKILINKLIWCMFLAAVLAGLARADHAVRDGEGILQLARTVLHNGHINLYICIFFSVVQRRKGGGLVMDILQFRPYVFHQGHIGFTYLLQWCTQWWGT